MPITTPSRSPHAGSGQKDDRGHAASRARAWGGWRGKLGPGDRRAEIETDGGNDHRLVAGIREHLRPRRRRGDVLADDFDGLRGNAESNEPSAVACGQTHGEIAAGIAEQQVVALHVQERGADLNALRLIADDAHADLGERQDVGAQLGAGGDAREAVGERRVESEDAVWQHDRLRRERMRRRDLRRPLIPFGLRGAVDEGGTHRDVVAVGGSIQRRTARAFHRARTSPPRAW